MIDRMLRLSGSTAVVAAGSAPTGQDFTNATTAGALSSEWLDSSVTLPFVQARDIGNGENVFSHKVVTAAFTSATANATADLQIISSPRNVVTLASGIYTFTAVTFVDGNVSTGADTITIASHGFPEGTSLTLSNSGGALPTGLAAATTYYVRNPTTNTFQLSLTVDGAIVDITAAAGGGTHTVAWQPQVLCSSGPIPLGRLRAGASGVGGRVADRCTLRLNPVLNSFRMPVFRYIFGRVMPSATLTAGSLIDDLRLGVHHRSPDYATNIVVS